MMDLRKRIIIISSLMMLGVLIIVLAIMASRRSAVEVANFDPDQPDATEDADAAFLSDTLDLPPVVGNPEAISPILANEDADERYVRQLAITFVERFGSFSNQNRNTHITDVLPLVTESMGDWIRTQLQSYSNEYKGSTSHVIVSSVEEFTDATAIIHIESQQVLETLTTVERVYNKGTVKLVVEDGEWKVSGLFWEE